MIITEIPSLPNPNIKRFYVREKITPKALHFYDEKCDEEIQKEFVKKTFQT